MIRACVALLLLAGTLFARAAGAQASAASARRLLVQRIEAVGVDARLARSLEEALLFELGARKGLTIVSPAELEQTVRFARDQAELGCDLLDECMAQVRKKLQVQHVLRGKLSRLGNDLVATFALIDSRSADVVERVTRQAGDFARLRAELAGAADELLGLAEPAPTFRLSPGATLKLAVMPFAARGVPRATAAAMMQILSTELNQIEGVRVISSDDIAALLAKVETEGKLGCTENMECVVEIGAALGLSKLVTGSVGKIGDTYVVAAQLIDTRQAEVQNRVLEAFAGDPDELARAIKLTAYRIAGIDYGGRPGGVDFTFNVDRARVRLGPRELQLRDRHLKLDGLPAGRYSLRVLADPEDYRPLQTDVYVAPGASNVRTFELKDKPVPWHSAWWFWTAVGVVAVSGTAVAIAASASEPATGSGVVVVR